MANKINIVITAEDKASRPIRSISDEMDGASGKSNKFKSALGAVGGALKTTAIAGGIAAAALSGAILSSAGDYEQSLNVFKSVSSATAAEMDAVATRARALGNDISLPGISAKDAAGAMVELSKAGLSVNDALDASKGVLALAKAGQLDTADAARIAANALNAFSLEGSQASRVADILSAAANASSADVGELAYGFQMASSSFAAVKAPIDDLAAALGLMSNNGIAGSDAGTSLKTMFMNLIPTTKRAKESMNALNLDFYDAKGNFVGVRNLIDQLQKGTSKLTDEQKALHIENIFGADSSRAANILLKEGVAGYDAMSKAVNRNGAATELAAAQNSGFKGAIDSVRSSLETVGIDIGMKVIPKLTELARLVASNIQPAFLYLKQVASGVRDVLVDVGGKVGDYLGPKLRDLWTSVQNNLVPVLRDLWEYVLVPLASVFGVVLVAAIGLAIDAIKFVSDALGVLHRGIVDGNPIIWGLVGLFGTLAGAMAFNAVFNALTIGFATFNLITVPSALTSIGLLKAAILSPIVMPAIAVGAAIAAILSVKAAYDGVQAAFKGEAAAKKSSFEAGVKLRESAEKRYREGKIDGKEWKRLMDISFNASGTNSDPGGWSLVGEHGPEIVNLPTGAAVTPAYQTRAQSTGSSSSPSVIIENFNSYNGQDNNRFLRDIGFYLELA